MKVEAILAHNLDDVIGKGDLIPWHHSGDFKRFKNITMGHNLLMGARTFLGIAKNYFNSSEIKEMLPGRTIFVLGTPRSPLGNMSHNAFRSIHKRGYGSDWNQLVHEIISELRGFNISRNNIRIILEDDEPQAILDRIELNYLKNGETLFVAGGATVYHKYLPLASKVHRTIINSHTEATTDLVNLTPAIIDILDNQMWSEVIDEGEEISNDLKATYRTLIA